MSGPTVIPRFDSRGLPEGYDPGELYQYRISKLKADAEGLELFVYRLMPPNLIRSFAFAIDPFSSLKVADSVITPWNRKKVRATASVLDERRGHNIHNSSGGSTIPNWQNIPGNFGPFEPTPPTHTDYTYGLSSQEVLPASLDDSTKRTRLINSDRGEFRRFDWNINSPPLRVQYSYKNSIYLDIPGSSYPSRSESYSEDVWVAEPHGAVLSKANFDAIKIREENVAIAFMQKHALSMFKDCHPSSRTITSFRNLVELRDLPRSISSLRELAQNLTKLERSLKMSPSLSKKLRSLRPLTGDIPKQYLSYHFGWKLLVRDALDLLNSPAKISKKINFLLARSGKPTTVHTRRSLIHGDPDVSGFDYPNLTFYEYDKRVSSRISRDIELRMALNYTFRFPDVNVPEFSSRLWRHNLGLNPRPIDIYNLVPWTWLVDWFTGLGNYLEIIDTISTDDTVINWGMITSVTKGNLTTERESKIDRFQGSSFNYAGSGAYIPVEFRNSSKFDYTFQLRKDLATIMDVKTTANVSTLTLYQQSILGAILAQSGRFRWR